MRFRAGLALLVAIVVGATAGRAQQEPRRQSILSLVTGQPALPWTSQITGSFVDVMESSEASPTLYFEYLDTARFDEPGFAEDLSEWLKFKYRDRAIDLLVIRGQPAVEFVARDESWRKMPALYTELGEIPDEITAALSNASGMSLEPHARAALETMVQLLPGTERVAFFYGATATEKTFFGGFGQQVKAAGLEPVDMGGLAMDELVRKVAALPADTTILFFPIQVDGAGKTFTADAACELISAAANRPMFSLYRVLVGCGVVGGLVLDFEVWGRALAERSLQLLEDPSLPTVIVPVEQHARLRFDARALARWGIDESRLPVGSVVELREQSLWRDYRPLVLAALGVGLLQALSIVVLVLERRRRQRAELATRRHLATIAHVDRIGAMGELAASLAHELGQPLAAIKANAKAAELMLAGGSADPGELQAILEDIRSDDRRAVEIIRGMREFLGKRELVKRPVDLNALVRETVSIVTPDANARGIEIDKDLAPSLPPASGESVHLQQVLVNLLLNGVAAVSNERGQRRHLRVQTAQNNGALEVAVSDRGHGIPDEQLKAIFEPFVTTKDSGLGMGLSIARSIIEAHEGSIEAENNPAGGATFRFRLPVPKET